MNFFDKQSDHPGPADLLILANLVQKDSKNIQADSLVKLFCKQDLGSCSASI